MVDDRIRYLVDLGHNLNPNPRMKVGPLTSHELDLLTISDVATQNMIASYQEIMSLRPDGDWGPLTDHSTRVERCGHPDYQEAGGGTFNNPCFTDGIRFSYRDRGRPSGFSKADAETMISNVVAANATVGARMTRVDEGDRQHIRITWEVLRGSTIGLAQLTNGPCDRGTLFCKINPNYARAGLVQMTALLCHEIAHNYGHQHQPSGILSPTIVQLSSWRGWERTDPAYRVWKRFAYNGFQPIPGPTPAPTPEAAIKLEVNGHIVTARDLGDRQLGQFLAIVQSGSLKELRPWSAV